MKPDYKVPSMEEIRQIKHNGLKVVSTFSGGGGSSLGYKMAGYKVALACEFVPAAAETYKSNFPETVIDGRDVRDVTGKELLERAKVEYRELDILDGSPPCSSFSTAGSREKGWGKTKGYSETSQRTDDLFFEYARLIEEMQPKVFVAENVSGLVKGKAKGYFLEILHRLKSCGYKVKCKVLNAAWLGVPQSRQRTIFVGVRNDLGFEPVYPKPDAFCYSLKDAIGDSKDGITAENDISKYAIGKEWDKIGKPGTQSEKYFQLVRPAWEKPCPTITATSAIVGSASVTHPSQKRKFSIQEIKRICSFPDDYILQGTYAQQVERMGRAVPPVMMKQIASRLALEIKRGQH